jgi:hypothetical protein
VQVCKDISPQTPQQRLPSSALFYPYHTLSFPINTFKCNIRISDTWLHNIHSMFDMNVNHKIGHTAIRMWNAHSLPQIFITVVKTLGSRTPLFYCTFYKIKQALVQLYALFLGWIFHNLVPLVNTRNLTPNNSCNIATKWRMSLSHVFLKLWTSWPAEWLSLVKEESA